MACAITLSLDQDRLAVSLTRLAGFALRRFADFSYVGHFNEIAGEFAAEPLDAARQIDVGTDHGEVKSVARSNVAI
jgi:hypothetical protein